MVGSDPVGAAESASAGLVGALPKFRDYKPYLPALATLMLALGTTAFFTWIAREMPRRELNTRMSSQAAMVRDTVSDALGSYAKALLSAAAFVNAAGKPTRASWHTFTSGLKMSQAYPGMQGLGYVKVIRGSEVEQLEKRQHQAGRPDFQVHPKGDLSFKTAIVFLEPEDWRNLRAIGYDMWSEPKRQAAMSRAIDTGEAVLSDRVTLLQEADVDVQHGALLYFPLYEGGFLPATLDERRSRIAGFVYCVIRLRDFLDRSFANSTSSAALSLARVEAFYGSESDKAPKVYDSATPKAGSPADQHNPLPAATSIVDVNVGNSNFVLRLTSLPALERSIDWSVPTLSLWAGTAISLLLAGIAASVAHGREQSSIAAARLAAEVGERRRAQEEVQLANNELIHRVKNTLTVVSAIASQTARHSKSLPTFIDAFRERLGALAKVNDLLRPDPAFTPDLKTFIVGLLGAYTTSARESALHIAGPNIEIPRNEATQFSLLVNELATNATKYGAWSSPDGTVSITWTLRSPASPDEDDAERVEWVWKESGGPPVTIPEGAGFGTHVITSIARALRGTGETHYDPDGLRFVLDFPRKVAAAADGNRDSATGRDRSV